MDELGTTETSQTTLHPKLAYRIDEACRELGIGRTSLYELMKQNKLKSAVVAGRRVIPGAELERLLLESLAQNGAET